MKKANTIMFLTYLFILIFIILSCREKSDKAVAYGTIEEQPLLDMEERVELIVE